MRQNFLVDWKNANAYGDENEVAEESDEDEVAEENEEDEVDEENVEDEVDNENEADGRRRQRILINYEWKNCNYYIMN